MHTYDTYLLYVQQFLKLEDTAFEKIIEDETYNLTGSAIKKFLIHCQDECIKRSVSLKELSEVIRDSDNTIVNYFLDTDNIIPSFNDFSSYIRREKIKKILK